MNIWMKRAGIIALTIIVLFGVGFGAQVGKHFHEQQVEDLAELSYRTGALEMCYQILVEIAGAPQNPEIEQAYKRVCNQEFNALEAGVWPEIEPQGSPEQSGYLENGQPL